MIWYLGDVVQLAHCFVLAIMAYSVPRFANFSVLILFVSVGIFDYFYFGDCPFTLYANYLFANEGVTGYPTMTHWMMQKFGSDVTIIESIISSFGAFALGCWYGRGKRTPLKETLWGIKD